jgi:hypothetical protein
VHNREDLHGALPQSIDHSVFLDQQLPNAWVFCLGDTPAALWERCKTVNGQNETLDKSIGVFDRISGDVILDMFEIGNGGVGLLKAGHFLMKRFFTSSCDTTHSSSTAFTPASIFLRTYTPYLMASQVAFSGSLFTRSRACFLQSASLTPSKSVLEV